jgi:predicted hotdog family 3-hydroxylacyl-ACP dehydratase
MEPVEKLVPHSGKMSLLSRVKAVDLAAHTLCAEVDVSPDSFFYDSVMGGVPVWVGFEYMAQSIAALSGKCNLEYGRRPNIGFILSVKNFKAKVHSFSKGTTISILVKELVQLDSIVSFECAITLNESVLAVATLNTIKIEDIESFAEKEQKL